MPTVSVIMGIFNCESTLPDAIGSILKQTYTDWEMIMCDDGSKDNTYKIAYEYQQKFPDKIFLIKNEINKGLNATLNSCLRKAKGKYIARMDGDDVCSPERFAEEILVLENEPEIAIVGTGMSYFDEYGVWGSINLPMYPQNEDFLKGTLFCHASSMVRKEAFDIVHGYTEDKRLLRVEDYHLWLKMYKAGLKGKNINRILYNMRDDRNAYKRRKFKYRINEAYVKCLAVRELELSKLGYMYAIKPILVGMLPKCLYNKLHKGRLSKNSANVL